ncbi:hypothetical protein [Sporolactobacillus laevolacticus]|uniref:hypothetical protein n=1 Tax=Sporolactobacillus laevolacticus TaxID=33018 RepID=UPI0025B48727|nr:hypothetical protein [Sporolactobacillus laevolacticus]MDN3956210.1 hypothetical protein [Sporolactobacillus laevolacticus]
MESESKNSQFFYCYDKELKNFLLSNGLRYITHAISIRDHMGFYMFWQSEELTKLITEFKQQKEYIEIN